MGKLMVHGKEASGTQDNALNVKYGNTNVAEAIANVQNNVDIVGSFALSNRVMISDTWQNRGYSKGEYAIYNNQLYVCILTHASGIVPTNATYWKATTVGSALNTVEVASLINKNSTYFRADYSYIEKYGKMAVLQIDVGLQNLPAGVTSDFVTIASLPSGFIPRNQHIVRGVGDNDIVCQWRIYSDGDLKLYATSNAFTGGRYQITYAVQ